MSKKLIAAVGSGAAALLLTAGIAGAVIDGENGPPNRTGMPYRMGPTTQVDEAMPGPCGAMDPAEMETRHEQMLEELPPEARDAFESMHAMMTARRAEMGGGMHMHRGRGMPGS
jgi:hypothetical protein